MAISVEEVIALAEERLPVIPAPDDEHDPRWQAIIAVGESIKESPEEVRSFVEKWGKHPQDDLRSAIACVRLAGAYAPV